MNHKQQKMNHILAKYIIYVCGSCGSCGSFLDIHEPQFKSRVGKGLKHLWFMWFIIYIKPMKLNYGVHIKIYTYIYPIITFPSSYGENEPHGTHLK